MNSVRRILLFLLAASAMACATMRVAVGQQLASMTQEVAQQRSQFKRLEKLASQPNSDEYRQLKSQLSDYPLLPYIELRTLQAHPYWANRDKIDEFLTRYEGTPLDWPLRLRWLRYLKQKNRHDAFIQYFRPTSNVELTCHYLTILLRDETRKQEVFAKVPQLWVVPKSQPKTCDVIFSAWTKAGLRTQEHVLGRLEKVANGGNHTLIPYLKRQLPVSHQYLADLWQSVRRSPSYVNRLSKFPGKFPELELAIIQYGLGRLVWSNENLALKTWSSVQRKYQVPVKQQRKIAETFAVALAIEEHPDADQWLEKANHQDANESVYRWHLAHVLKNQDWRHVLEVVDQVPGKHVDDLSYQYWRARALAFEGASERSIEDLTRLASHRHYYGFLASAQIDIAPSLVDRPLSIAAADLRAVAQRSSAQRAYEFLQMQRFSDARREWFYLLRQLNEDEKLVAAVLADEWQWHDRAIFGFSQTGYLDDVKRRFPIAYEQLLVQKSQQNNIDPAWAFAIARRESSFMADASSHAGARGLMQLMPGTARYLANKKIRNSSLFDPNVNSGLGTQYLRYLLDKMDNNPILATASYNAGWRKVQQWVPQDNVLPADIWIETIPYKETRNYVKAVLAYRQIYSQQLGSTTSLFNEVIDMELGHQ